MYASVQLAGISCYANGRSLDTPLCRDPLLKFGQSGHLPFKLENHGLLLINLNHVLGAVSARSWSLKSINHFPVVQTVRSKHIQDAWLLFQGLDTMVTLQVFLDESWSLRD
jgi:hypothetical protein